jgi:ABC-2 type transport system ATP-binding protein
MTAHANELTVYVRGLRKQYGDATAVDGIDLGIRRGEAFGLLGPNGAGKSTTVEILQGHRSRDAGEVSVLGADPARGTRAWRSRVGIVWQDESAPAELTVAETVRHFARYYPRPRDPGEVMVWRGCAPGPSRWVGTRRCAARPATVQRSRSCCRSGAPRDRADSRPRGR